MKNGDLAYLWSALPRELVPSGRNIKPNSSQRHPNSLWHYFLGQLSACASTRGPFKSSIDLDFFSLLIFRCCTVQRTFEIYLKLVLCTQTLQLAAKRLLSLRAVTQATIHCAFSLENWKQDNLTQEGKQVLHTPQSCGLSTSKSWMPVHFHD